MHMLQTSSTRALPQVKCRKNSICRFKGNERTGVSSGSASKAHDRTVQQQPLMATYTLYTYPLAYNPFKSALALAEKGVPHTGKYTDLFNGQSLSPEYLAINPKATVPALVVEGGPEGRKVIPDSRQIMEYVNQLAPGPLGGSDADQKLAAKWVDKLDKWDGNLFIAANGDPGAAKLLGGLQQFKIKYAEARAKEHPELQQVYADKIAAMKAADAENADAAAGDANRQQLVGLLDEAEAQLAKTPFLAGRAYSVADVMFTPVLFRLGMANKTAQYLKPRPNVSQYYDRMKQRPSFQKVFGPAGSKLTLATTILPALVRAQFASFTGRY